MLNSIIRSITTFQARRLPEEPDVNISKEPLSSLAAARSFFDELPGLVKKRQEIQSKRKRDDRAIFTYFKSQFMPVSSDPEYQKNHIEILKNLGIQKIFEKDIKRKVVIVSGDPVSKEHGRSGYKAS